MSLILLFGSQGRALRLSARAVVLAMGCRERNRGNVRIPGIEPAGIFTAGLAQRLVNVEGYVPCKEVVIIGSGDIGLIMAGRDELDRLQGPRGDRDPALSLRALRAISSNASTTSPFRSISRI